MICLKEIIKNLANTLSLLKKYNFLPSHVSQSSYVKVVQLSIMYAMPVWGWLIRQNYLKHWKDNTTVLLELFFSFSPDMPTVDVLATNRWNTCSLTHLCKCALIHNMPCRTLAEELIVYGKNLN